MMNLRNLEQIVKHLLNIVTLIVEILLIDARLMVLDIQEFLLT